MTNFQTLQLLIDKYDFVDLGQDENKTYLHDVYTPVGALPAPISEFIVCHFKTTLLNHNQIKFIVNEKN